MLSISTKLNLAGITLLAVFSIILVCTPANAQLYLEEGWQMSSPAIAFPGDSAVQARFSDQSTTQMIVYSERFEDKVHIKDIFDGSSPIIRTLSGSNGYGYGSGLAVIPDVSPPYDNTPDLLISDPKTKRVHVVDGDLLEQTGSPIFKTIFGSSEWFGVDITFLEHPTNIDKSLVAIANDQTKIVYFYRLLDIKNQTSIQPWTLLDSVSENFESFGGNIKTGLINKDDYPDLVVSAEGANSNEGLVIVYDGAALFDGAITLLGVLYPDGKSKYAEGFGASIAVASGDGDSEYGAIAVGSPNYSLQEAAGHPVTIANAGKAAIYLYDGNEFYESFLGRTYGHNKQAFLGSSVAFAGPRNQGVTQMSLVVGSTGDVGANTNAGRITFHNAEDAIMAYASWGGFGKIVGDSSDKVGSQIPEIESPFSSNYQDVLLINPDFSNPDPSYAQHAQAPVPGNFWTTPYFGPFGLEGCNTPGFEKPTMSLVEDLPVVGNSVTIKISDVPKGGAVYFLVGNMFSQTAGYNLGDISAHPSVSCFLWVSGPVAKVLYDTDNDGEITFEWASELTPGQVEKLFALQALTVDSSMKVTSSTDMNLIYVHY